MKIPEPQPSSLVTNQVWKLDWHFRVEWDHDRQLWTGSGKTLILKLTADTQDCPALNGIRNPGSSSALPPGS